MYVDMTLDIGMLIILSKTSSFWDSADYNGTACQTKVLLGSMTIFWSAVLTSLRAENCDDAFKADTTRLLSAREVAKAMCPCQHHDVCYGVWFEKCTTRYVGHRDTDERQANERRQTTTRPQQARVTLQPIHELCPTATCAAQLLSSLIAADDQFHQLW